MEARILEAMFAVDGKSGKYPEFQGNVAAVYTHPLSKRWQLRGPLRRKRRNLHERGAGHGAGDDRTVADALVFAASHHRGHKLTHQLKGFDRYDRLKLHLIGLAMHRPTDRG